jgi:3-phenylpropionate/trans-cinnamate dioxygenase ferredoxin subunit
VPRHVPVGTVDQLPPGQRKLAFVDGSSIVLFNVGGTVYAIDNSCPHNGSSLAGGKLEGHVLQCPGHGLRFDLRTGCMPNGGLCVKKFQVGERDGKLVVIIDDSGAETPPVG